MNDQSVGYALSSRNMLTVQILLAIIVTFATVIFSHINTPLIHFCFFMAWVFFIAQMVQVLKIHWLLGIPL